MLKTMSNYALLVTLLCSCSKLINFIVKTAPPSCSHKQESRSWFYHDLYQYKLHHKGRVRHETSLVNRKHTSNSFIPLHAQLCILVIPVMLAPLGYRLFRKLSPHISRIPNGSSLACPNPTRTVYSMVESDHMRLAW